jgi:serine phosphatase RsbU (regulator of sigma subunit)
MGGVAADHPADGPTVDHLMGRVSMGRVSMGRRPRWRWRITTDRFERIRCRRPLALAAEVQWKLLPVLSYASDEFSIAGNLEPAYDIGGDTFDYAVDPTAITDARGHGLRAALLGALAITAMRNSRRCGEGLVDQARAANAALLRQFSDVPGDRLVLFTDGITEAAPDGGSAFGLAQLVEMAARARSSPRTWRAGGGGRRP